MKGFTRPPVSILPEEALVPARNVISPPPNQFTHELTSDQPYYFEGSQKPDGTLTAGTRVHLLRHDGGKTCCVADGRGLYVQVDHTALRKL
jgi:hypothetical protein